MMPAAGWGRVPVTRWQGHLCRLRSTRGLVASSRLHGIRGGLIGVGSPERAGGAAVVGICRRAAEAVNGSWHGYDARGVCRGGDGPGGRGSDCGQVWSDARLAAFGHVGGRGAVEPSVAGRSA